MEKIQLQRVLPNEIEQRSFEIITQELRVNGGRAGQDSS